MKERNNKIKRKRLTKNYSKKSQKVLVKEMIKGYN